MLNLILADSCILLILVSTFVHWCIEELTGLLIIYFYYLKIVKCELLPKLYLNAINNIEELNVEGCYDICLCKVSGHLTF